MNEAMTRSAAILSAMLGLYPSSISSTSVPLQLRRFPPTAQRISLALSGGSLVFGLQSSVFGLQSSVFCLLSSVFSLLSSVFGLQSPVFYKP